MTEGKKTKHEERKKCDLGKCKVTEEEKEAKREEDETRNGG